MGSESAGAGSKFPTAVYTAQEKQFGELFFCDKQ